MAGLRTKLSFLWTECQHNLGRHADQSCSVYAAFVRHSSSNTPEKEFEGCKSESLKKKLREKTPIGKLDELEEGRHPFQEKEPLQPWPQNTNPHTGEVGGPKGPEPTRYGDWERKGRVSDF